MQARFCSSNRLEMASKNAEPIISEIAKNDAITTSFLCLPLLFCIKGRCIKQCQQGNVSKIKAWSGTHTRDSLGAPWTLTKTIGIMSHEGMSKEESEHWARCLSTTCFKNPWKCLILTTEISPRPLWHTDADTYTHTHTQHTQACTYTHMHTHTLTRPKSMRKRCTVGWNFTKLIHWFT